MFVGLVILEYLVIYVFFLLDNYDFEVVKDVRFFLIRSEFKRFDRDESSTFVGIIFKEEEIVEDERVFEF